LLAERAGASVLSHAYGSCGALDANEIDRKTSSQAPDAA
jgi:hypothetical protein